MSDSSLHKSKYSVSNRNWLRLAASVHRVEQSVRQSLKAASANENINAAELLLLLCCLESPQGALQQDLIVQTGCSPALVSKHIESLRARGFVSNQRSAHDRRRQSWNLTDSGSTAARRLSAALSTNANDATLQKQLLGLSSALEAMPTKSPTAATSSPENRGMAA